VANDADLSDRFVAASEARGFSEVAAKSLASLIAPRYVGARVPQLLLNVALLDLGRGGEAGAQRMLGKFPLTLAFPEIRARPGR